MKIIFINYEFPPLGGGAGNACYNLAKEIVNKGHDVLVVTSKFNSQSKASTIDGINIIRIPVIRKKLESVSIFELLTFTLSSIWHIPSIAKKFKPDKNIAIFGIPCGITALLLKKLYKIPYIVSLRGADVPGFIERQVRFYHFISKKLIKLIWKEASNVTCNSNGLKKLACNTLKNIDIRVIPNGVDSNFFSSNGNHNKKITILYVGRLSKQKGLNNLIEPIKALKQKSNIPFQLNIVGDGPEKKQLIQKFKQNKLDDIVKFSGWINKAELIKQYQSASIFLFPSLSEGMPNAILEAMASGLPIIATKVAGNEELVRNNENGYLVPINNSKILTDKLIDLIECPNKMREMGKRSRHIAKTEYTWEYMANEYIKLSKNTITKN